MEIDGQEMDLDCDKSVDKSFIKSRDEVLREIKKQLKYMFLKGRYFGPISIQSQTIDKGFKTSESWICRIEISGLNTSQITEIKDTIRSKEWTVRLSEMKTEDEMWCIEIA